MLCQLLALASLVVAYTQRDGVTIEGAYFTRDTDDPGSFALEPGAYATSGSPATPWLIAAAALLVAGTALLVLAALRRSR